VRNSIQQLPHHCQENLLVKASKHEPGYAVIKTEAFFLSCKEYLGFFDVIPDLRICMLA
jgi:hypothetical protein